MNKDEVIEQKDLEENLQQQDPFDPQLHKTNEMLERIWQQLIEERRINVK
jgi:hypothetical protein